MKSAATSTSASKGSPHAPPSSFTFVRHWLPVFLWMFFIFGMSTNAGSSRNTSRIIGPILRWFNPDVSNETVSAIQLVVRKCAHFTEYGVLALLLWRARRKPFPGDERPWRRKEAFMAFVGAALFAISDEWHQSYVPSREASVRDVLIDSCGAAFALWALWCVGRRLRKW